MIKSKEVEVTANETAVLLKYGSREAAIDAWRHRHVTDDDMWELCVVMHWKGVAWLKEK